MDISVLRSIGQVHAWIAARGGRIGLEGFCGVGKSTLAASLEDRAAYTAVDTDTFVKVRDGDTYYVERLDLERIKLAIEEKGAACDSTTIVHGICLRDTMQRIGLSLDAFVYIKRVSQPTIDATLWHEGIDLEQLRNGEAFLGQHEEPHRSAWS